eukprot:8773660-Heterocapsa_arctica.AAC.1
MKEVCCQPSPPERHITNARVIFTDQLLHSYEGFLSGPPLPKRVKGETPPWDPWKSTRHKVWRVARASYRGENWVGPPNGKRFFVQLVSWELPELSARIIMLIYCLDETSPTPLPHLSCSATHLRLVLHVVDELPSKSAPKRGNVASGRCQFKVPPSTTFSQPRFVVKCLVPMTFRAAGSSPAPCACLATKGVVVSEGVQLHRSVSGVCPVVQGVSVAVPRSAGTHQRRGRWFGYGCQNACFPTYRGYWGKGHCWLIVTVVPPEPGEEVRCDAI